jgi:ABC-type glycerol-3-phosphate transport system permease component
MVADMRVKMSSSRKVFVIINYVFLLVVSLSFLVPLLTVVTGSIVGEVERMERGTVILIPRTIDLTGYRILLSKGSAIYRAYANTLFLVSVGTFLSLTVTAMLAYAMSKKYLPGRNVMLIAIFITMIFNGGLIPRYLLVHALGLIDSLWAIILSSLVSAWYMLIMRNFFYAIPQSLEESALLDGASPFVVFLRIALPLSKPVLATIGMFYAVMYWNEWFAGVIYINSTIKLPMQNMMRNIIALYSPADINAEVMNDENFLSNPPIESLQMATIVIGTIPILLVYPFVQRYYVKGVIVGAIKG